MFTSNVNAGNTVSSETVDSGFQNIFSGGTATIIDITGSGIGMTGSQRIYSGGVASITTISGGGRLFTLAVKPLLQL
jgi:autotransporter passenger strand-loop-strand repeat protein